MIMYLCGCSCRDAYVHPHSLSNSSLCRETIMGMVIRHSNIFHCNTGNNLCFPQGLQSKYSSIIPFHKDGNGSGFSCLPRAEYRLKGRTNILTALSDQMTFSRRLLLSLLEFLGFNSKSQQPPGTVQCTTVVVLPTAKLLPQSHTRRLLLVSVVVVL